MIVWEGMKHFATIRVPDFSGKSHHVAVSIYDEATQINVECTYAVKSALPDAAREVSGDSLLDHTAPLWPKKVPIQSPVHSRNIGFPSLQLDMST